MVSTSTRGAGGPTPFTLQNPARQIPTLKNVSNLYMNVPKLDTRNDGQKSSSIPRALELAVVLQKWVFMLTTFERRNPRLPPQTKLLQTNKTTRVYTPHPACAPTKRSRAKRAYKVRFEQRLPLSQLQPKPQALSYIRRCPPFPNSASITKQPARRTDITSAATYQYKSPLRPGENITPFHQLFAPAQPSSSPTT